MKGLMKLRNPVEEASYIVFTDGSKYYVKNGLTGVIEYSDADASKAIQYAVDMVDALGGGKVVIKRGSYPITSSIKVGNNIIIEGEGIGATILYRATSSWIAIITNKDWTNGNKNIVIRNLEVDGRRTTEASPGPEPGLIQLTRVMYGIVERVYAHHNISYGIELTCCKRCMVVNSFGSDCGEDAITVMDGSYSPLNNPSLSESEDIVIMGNVVWNNSMEGISVCNGPKRVTVVGNIVLSSNRGGLEVFVDPNNIAPTDVIFADNVVANTGLTNTDKAGIFSEPYGSAPRPARVVIKGNIIYNTKNPGIRVLYNDDVVIEGNLIANISNKGILVKNSTNVSIVGNEVRETTDRSIHVMLSTDVLIANNKVYVTTASDQINVVESYCSSRVLIVGNHVVGVARDGAINANAWNDADADMVYVIGNFARNLKSDGDCFVFNTSGGKKLTNLIVEGNVCYSTPYGITIWDANVIGARIERNKLINVTTPIYNNGSNTVIRRNIGYLTENSGVATISAGSTRVTVSHGLAITPSKVLITPLAQPPGKIWVENITSTSFDIVTDTAPATDLNVAWYAEV